MSDQEQENWPTIESQESYWRTKEADLSLDKVEATTDYLDHFLAGNTDSGRPFPVNETDLSRLMVERPDEVEGSSPLIANNSGGGDPTAQNFCLSIEDRKAPSDSTLAEQKWAEPEWTLRDEVGESYREIP